MPFPDSAAPAFAGFLLDEAGASTLEFLRVGSLAVTLLTWLVLAFDKALRFEAT